MDAFEKEIHEDYAYIVNKGKIYKYLDLKGGITMLHNCTLLFKNPRYFNDPYDCYNGLISFELVPDNYRSYVLQKYSSLISPEDMGLIINALNTTSNEQMSETYRNILIEDVFSHVGLCCFSEEYENLLMWSHYSDAHKGICIGLDINKLRPYIASINPVLIKVKYKPDFKAAEYFVNHRQALSYCLQTKSVLWEYEKEIRIALFQLTLNENHQFLLDMGREVITEIYLGSKIKPEAEQVITSICKEKYPMAKVSRLKLADNSFNLISEEL